MRPAILIVLFLCAIASFAQEWVDYYHDSTLVVSMPYYHYEREMNGPPTSASVSLVHNFTFHLIATCLK